MQNYIHANDESRARLEKFARRLSDEQLTRPLKDGWTAAAFLAHLAFWDQRALLLLRKWKREGVGQSTMDTDILNEASLPFWRAIPPQKAVELTLETARLVDAEVASLPPALIVEIEAKATQFHISRAVHRNMHLDELEGIFS
jgi:hypothetical protein